MKKLIVILLLSPLLVFGNESDENYPNCINITKYVVEHMETLEINSLFNFFKQFSMEENKNNVEFAEWGNEVLFEVLDKKTELFFKTLYTMSDEQIKSIQNEINSPINDGIDMIKLYKNIESSTLDKKIKLQALSFIKPSYEAYKKMIKDWEEENNKEWGN